jgi:hypothetical protein
MNSKTKANSYFSVDYTQARERFRSWFSGIDTQDFPAPLAPTLETFQVPSKVDADLTVDAVYIPARGKKKDLMILISGVHGPETYAGSAIQMMVGHELAAPKDKIDKTNPDVGWILIHALNPYGFKYNRRVTENNVNLNRNCSIHRDLFKIKNKDYLSFRSLFEPKGMVESFVPTAAKTVFTLAKMFASGKLPYKEFGNALGKGQYDFSEGLEYGGRDFEPQIEFVKYFLARYGTDYQRVSFFDLHTGLGEKYTLHLLHGQKVDQTDYERMKHLLPSPCEDNTYITTPSDDPGFYEVDGDTCDMVTEMWAKDKSLTAVTLEFGTRGHSAWQQIEGVFRLIVENQGHHYGYKTQELEKKVKQKFLDQFYPDSDKWRNSVIEKSRNVFSRVLKRI